MNLLALLAVGVTMFFTGVLLSQQDQPAPVQPTADVCLPLGGGDPNMAQPS